MSQMAEQLPKALQQRTPEQKGQTVAAGVGVVRFCPHIASCPQKGCSKEGGDDLRQDTETVLTQGPLVPFVHSVNVYPKPDVGDK